MPILYFAARNYLKNYLTTPQSEHLTILQTLDDDTHLKCQEIITKSASRISRLHEFSQLLVFLSLQTHQFTNRRVNDFTVNNIKELMESILNGNATDDDLIDYDWIKDDLTMVLATLDELSALLPQLDVNDIALQYLQYLSFYTYSRFTHNFLVYKYGNYLFFLESIVYGLLLGFLLGKIGIFFDLF